jgi:tRNA-binding protein
MLIASYNRKVLGDILVVVVDQDGEEQVTEVKNNVAIIKDVENDRVLGFNFLNVSQILGEIEVNGQVFLTPEQVEKLNQVLRDNEITAELEFDDSPKFVVGYVESLEEHPNSDHLHITKTRVDNNQEVQIVSGSPNIANDIRVVVAKVGAMMPSGLIIFPGELRGVASNGMICSGRELEIKNAPQKPGALILPNDFQEVGQPFDFKLGDLLFQ